MRVRAHRAPPSPPTHHAPSPPGLGWIAGIGNIYRCEILFRAGIHPEQPCGTLDREQMQRIWDESTWCLRRGFEKGSILTVDPAEGLPEPWKRRYIYNHKRCGRCRAPIISWDMAARTSYACSGTCQPLQLEGGVEGLTTARQKAFAAARQHKSFVSHCAPEPAAASSSAAAAADGKAAAAVATTTRKKRPRKGATGVKAEEATEVEEGGEEASGDVDDIGAITITATITPGPSTPTSAQPPSVETPEQRIVGPAAAAAEKARAGEGRNVEHVALEDETEEAGSKRARKL